MHTREELSSHTGQVLSIVKIAGSAFPAIAQKFGGGHTGGFIYIVGHDKYMHAHMRLGHPPKASWKSFMDTSKREAENLLAHEQFTLSSQMRSWGNRHFDAGGAVRVDRFVLSFRGLPHSINEPFLMAIACVESLVSQVDAEKLFSSLRVPHPFDEILAIVDRTSKQKRFT